MNGLVDWPSLAIWDVSVREMYEEQVEMGVMDLRVNRVPSMDRI
jgi:hypothetical protein